MSILSDLKQAKARLKGGWIQGVMKTYPPTGVETPRYCLLGSILHSDNYPQIRKMMAFAIDPGTPGDYFTEVTRFNDQDDRTQDEVIALVDLLIKKEEQNESTSKAD